MSTRAHEVLHTVHEAKVLIERWRRQYNTVRPHSSLGNRPPAPETVGVRSRGVVTRPPSAALRPASQQRERHGVF